MFDTRRQEFNAKCKYLLKKAKDYPKRSAKYLVKFDASLTWENMLRKGSCTKSKDLFAPHILKFQETFLFKP